MTEAPDSNFSLIAVRGVMLVALFVPVAWAIIQRRRFVPWLKSFLTPKAPALNLAVFRLFILAAMWLNLKPDKTRFFASLPEDLLFPPYKWELLFPFFPINPSFAGAMTIIMQVALILAFVGLFTRTSLWVVFITSIYCFGVPNFFGKVHHDTQHLIWFVLLLACSPSGAVLSLDSVRRSWKRADNGDIAPPTDSPAYGTPIRCAWVLLGILYFFPGWWKPWKLGLQWLSAENFHNTMYNAWFTFDMQPLNWLDGLPWMVWMAAAATLAFELGFIFLIAHPITRWMVVPVAFTFHFLTKFMLGIWFWSLQLTYAMFVDWRRGFRWLGVKLFPQDAVLLFDGNCELCRRAIASIRVFDVFERIRYVNALDSEAVAASGHDTIPPGELLQDMHYVVGPSVAKGYESYRLLARRIPLLWVAIPFLYLPPVAAVGQRVYRRVADSRTCSVPLSPKSQTAGVGPYRLGRLFWPAAMGLALANVYMGVRGFDAGWPVACYPRFDFVSTPEVRLFDMESVDATGEAMPMNMESFRDRMGISRYDVTVSRIFQITDPIERERKMRAFVQARMDWEGEGSDATLIRLYQIKYTTIPDRADENPLSREAILEVSMTEPSATVASGE